MGAREDAAHITKIKRNLDGKQIVSMPASPGVHRRWERTFGQRFPCPECEWVGDSSEALLDHAAKHTNLRW